MWFAHLAQPVGDARDTRVLFLMVEPTPLFLHTLEWNGHVGIRVLCGFESGVRGWISFLSREIGGDEG